MNPEENFAHELRTAFLPFIILFFEKNKIFSKIPKENRHEYVLTYNDGTTILQKITDDLRKYFACENDGGTTLDQHIYEYVHGKENVFLTLITIKSQLYVLPLDFDLFKIEQLTKDACSDFKMSLYGRFNIADVTFLFEPFMTLLVHLYNGKNHTCSLCETVSSLKLSLCSRCRKVYYCSKKCQGKDWKEHKKTCRK